MGLVVRVLNGGFADRVGMIGVGDCASDLGGGLGKGRCDGLRVSGFDLTFWVKGYRGSESMLL